MAFAIGLAMLMQEIASDEGITPRVLARELSRDAQRPHAINFVFVD